LGGGAEISKPPKLIIKVFGQPIEDVCELEQASYMLNFETGIVLVEKQRVRSYDELVQQATQDKYKDREYIEVVLLPTIVGG
jgi:hypothetical protein